MSAPTLSPEMTLSEAAESAADYVFSLESDTVRQESSDLTRWESLPVFDDPLSLFSYQGKGEPNVTFRIGGDMPDELVIFTRSKEDLRLKQDEYVQFFLDRFLSIVDGHEHDLCAGIIRQIKEQKRTREEFFKAQEELGRTVEATFAIGTKDAMKSDFAKGQVLSWLKPE